MTATAPPGPTEVAIVTLCSTPRLDHLRRQLAVLSRRAVAHARSIVVWVGDDAPPALEGIEVLHLPPGPHGLRLAAGRNRGFDRAIELGA